MNVLARHIGHRSELLDERRLRCHDCSHTLMLPAGVAATSTSSKDLPNLNHPDACPHHPGWWSVSCGPCRAERIALADNATRPATPTGADPTANPEWQEARARHTKPEQPKRPQPDPDQAERLAEARAELDALHAQQTAAQAADTPSPEDTTAEAAAGHP